MRLFLHSLSFGSFLRGRLYRHFHCLRRFFGQNVVDIIPRRDCVTKLFLRHFLLCRLAAAAVLCRLLLVLVFPMRSAMRISFCFASASQCLVMASNCLACSPNCCWSAAILSLRSFINASMFDSLLAISSPVAPAPATPTVVIVVLSSVTVRQYELHYHFLIYFLFF